MFRSYDKDKDISYSLGAFPTVELIKRRPEDIEAIALHSKFKMTDEVAEILKSVKDKVFVDDRSVERVAKKGNTFMVGAFKKRFTDFGTKTHVTLVNPSDAGNLGTILRTMVGFGINNLAIVGESVDVYDPRTVRASMGGIFSVNIERYADWDGYAARHTEDKYLFMLGASVPLNRLSSPQEPYSLIFGNEASGLPAELASTGQPVVIKHTHNIDSLNLPQAVAIALYEITKDNFNN